MITVRAVVASVYLQIRTQQAQLNSAERNIRSQQSLLKLADGQYQNGLTSNLDVTLATQVLAATKAELPVIQGQLAQNISRLGVLLGESPDALQKELQPVRLISLPPPTVVAGIPADRLRKRPDIRAAERRFAVQTTQIGITTDDLSPSLSLTGTLGLSSHKTENIFDPGKIIQQITVEDAQAELALYSYELSIQKAINEVADSLAGYHEHRLRIKALGQSMQASKEEFEMSTRLYKDGLTSFQNLIDAQKSLFVTENDLAVARGTTGIQLVGLYKALAGGWTTAQENGQSTQLVPEKTMFMRQKYQEMNIIVHSTRLTIIEMLF